MTIDGIDISDEEIKALIKIIKRKQKEDNFYYRNNICPSCGAKMTLEDDIYQCDKCGYTHIKEMV